VVPPEGAAAPPGTVAEPTERPPGGRTVTLSERDRRAVLRLMPAPTRASGVELLGAMSGSGYREPPSLVRRADGQVIQITPLLHTVLSALRDGRRYGQVATIVGARTGRRVTVEDILYLVETKLRPLGLVVATDGSEPEPERANPLLGLRFKYVITDPAVTRRITAPFALLFRPWIVAAVMGAFALTTWWVLFQKGLSEPTFEAFYEPKLLLLVFALTVISAGFHEFGHAAACRYGGVAPGSMGAGLYLVWPAFYTEVTDSYQLDRRGRLRVDLGGLYFNAVFAVATFGVWAVVRRDALLLVIAAQLFQMLRQLVPIVRFDGYHILADLAGVPDLFARLKPTLLAMLPWRWGRPENRVLKPWARLIVTTWVVVVIPALGALLVFIVWVLPTLAATAWDSLGLQWEAFLGNLAEGDVYGIGVRVLSVVSLALPVLAMAYLLARVVRRTVIKARAATAEDPLLRAAALLVAAFILVGIGWVWWPQGQWEPLQLAERERVSQAESETLVLRRQAVPTTRMLGTQAGVRIASPGLRFAAPKGEPPPIDTTPAPIDTTPSPPANGRPELAVVVLPSQAHDQARSVVPGPKAPPPGADWPFPFPPPPEPGPDDNRALAVNTEDGSSVYEVALALVWVTDGETVDQSNEAWALASCTDCDTTAIAFQVVLVIGYVDTYQPTNIAVAANYDCDNCTTHALAVQLVATLTEMPDDEVMGQLALLWQYLEHLFEHVELFSIEEIYAQLLAVKATILEILADAEPVSDATAVDQDGVSEPEPSPSPTTEASPTAEPTPTESTSDDRGDSSGDTTDAPSATSEEDDQAVESETGTGGGDPGDDPDGGTTDHDG
jgi:putative peptide zinc metalloprotease protein